MKTAKKTPAKRKPFTLLTEEDLYLFNEGSHFRLYEKLGAHEVKRGKGRGVFFAVWAPEAEEVRVVGDFNGWSGQKHALKPHGNSGIWEGYIKEARPGSLYKYRIRSRHGGQILEKADPFAFYCENPPKSASVVWDLAYDWSDGEWMRKRVQHNALNAPISVYEIHLGSWKRNAEGKALTYRELARELPAYVKKMGFTHVEFLPVMEHPFYGSWGYQITGYFAPTSRCGPPQDFMYLVDVLHREGIGVILDWVPSHFPSDGHGLARFDGSCLYEHEDPRLGFHPDWKSAIFNYGRHEVKSFLISSALFWLERYHADALRVDAVASMLYLDYSRKEGEWIPNRHGGRENLDAIDFLKRLNEEVYRSFPDAQTIAEESTAWPAVSRPTYAGGLGFGMKWDMGWMHDTLEYMKKNPVHRSHHHSQITFRMIYAFHENFMMPLSHDEVVHGKGSLLEIMPGDDWRKFAQLRMLLGYLYAQPGKKLLFMGSEFGQRAEWNHEQSLDWHLLQHPPHQGLERWTEDLNRFYASTPALYEKDCDPLGFEWIDAGDAEASVLSFLRRGTREGNWVAAVFNFTPVPRYGYRIGLPCQGKWKERLNSDSEIYAGSGVGNQGEVEASASAWHGRPYSAELTLPPLAAVLFSSPEGELRG